MASDGGRVKIGLWFDAGGAIVRKEGRGKEGKEKREKRKKERRRVSYPHSHTL